MPYLRSAVIALTGCAALSFLTACRGDPVASPSASVASTPVVAASQPTAADRSPLPSTLASSSPSAAPPTNGVGSARQLLDAMIGSAPMEIEEVAHDASVGEVWDASIAERIANQVHVDARRLRVAVARPLPGREGELPAGWTIVAVEHPGGNPVGVLGAYLDERLTKPGTETALVDQLDDDRDVVFGSRFGAAYTDTVLLIMGYEPVAYFTDPKADAAHAEAVIEALAAATDALPLPRGRSEPPRTPTPTDDNAPTPPPDSALERALPATIDGQRLSITSAASVVDPRPDRLDAGLFGHMLPHFEQSGDEAAVAFASSEGFRALIVAHRLAGRTGDELLAAALGELWANPGGFQLYRGAEIDGRRYVYHQDWGFYAQGDVLYFLLYYGGYECSQASCTFGPEPELADLIREVVGAIP